MAHRNGEIPDGANGNGHSPWTGSSPLDLGLNGAQRYERLESTTTTNNNRSAPPTLNRYAIAVALLASFNSVLLGYGTLSSPTTSYSPICIVDV